MKFLFLITSIALLVSCAPLKPQIASRMSFPESEYLVLAKTGDATVRGQAFLKTRGGDIKTAAGNEVLLNPVTSYSLEWYEKSYLNGMKMELPDPRTWNYVAKQIADGSGRFTFKNVAPGDYFVTTGVTWEAPTGYQGALQVQGGVITKRITVRSGDVLDVVITR